MLKVLGLHDTCCREHGKWNHRHNIRVDLEPLFTHPEDDGKSESYPYYILLERSSLYFLAFDLEFDGLRLERIKLHKKHPCNHEHDDYIRNHSEHPSRKCDCITCILKCTKSDCIRRSTDRSTHTTDIGCDRNCEGKRDPSAAILRQGSKHRCKERKHHRSCRCVAHKH